LFHSEKYFGDIRTQPTNKVEYLMDLGPQAMCIQMDHKLAPKSYNFMIPGLDILAICKMKEYFEALE